MKKFPYIFIMLIILFTLQLQTMAFRGAERERNPDREFERPHYNTQHRQENNTSHRQKSYPHNNNDKVAESNSLANAHKENAPEFSQQHYKMNPHAGIPTQSSKNQANKSQTNKTVNSQDQNTTTNNSDNSTTNNTYNYYGNSGWNGGNYYGWNNGGWSGWNSGLLYGTLFGATLGTALTASYLPYNTSLYYPEPVYSYYGTPVSAQAYPVSTYHPTTTNTESSSDALPANETWTKAQNGIFPKNAVVNNTENGKATYYCRTTYMNQLSYGVLVANDGCYIENSSVTMRFTQYEVLTQK